MSKFSVFFGFSQPNTPHSVVKVERALDNLFSTGGYFNGDQYLIFDSDSICLIKSAKFYADSNNTVTFELRDNNGNVIDDTLHNVIPGVQILPLNFEVPSGTNMQLGASSNSGLYRNNSGVTYPYDIGDLISITSSSAGDNYYYFYYDVEVETPCIILNGLDEYLEDVRNEVRLLNITDILGREVKGFQNGILFYIYDDGTVEKKIIIE